MTDAAADADVSVTMTTVTSYTEYSSSSNRTPRMDIGTCASSRKISGEGKEGERVQREVAGDQKV